MARKERNAGKIMSYVFIVAFIIFGIGLFIHGISGVVNPQVWIETEGIIFREEQVRRSHQGRLRWEWDTYVEYVVNGEMFRERLGSFTISRGVGSEITFFRNETRPRQIYLRMPPAGGVTLVFSFVPFMLAGLLYHFMKRINKVNSEKHPNV